MRRIETDAGTIVGTVDRVARAVVWSLECPDCAELIPLDNDMFRGRKLTRCAGCGWKMQSTGTLEQSGPNGIYVYPDFVEAAFGSPVSHVEPGGIDREMMF